MLGNGPAFFCQAISLEGESVWYELGYIWVLGLLWSLE